jgi:putative endonuclease
MMDTVRDKNGYFYVYVLKSKTDGKWYTGCTGDLRKRFTHHQESKVSSTKGRGPFDIIYYEAAYDKDDAFDRERYLKTGMGKRYLRNRLKRFLSLTA